MLEVLWQDLVRELINLLHDEPVALRVPRDYLVRRLVLHYFECLKKKGRDVHVHVCTSFRVCWIILFFEFGGRLLILRPSFVFGLHLILLC